MKPLILKRIFNDIAAYYAYYKPLILKRIFNDIAAYYAYYIFMSNRKFIESSS